MAGLFYAYNSHKMGCHTLPNGFPVILANIAGISVLNFFVVPSD